MVKGTEGLGMTNENGATICCDQKSIATNSRKISKFLRDSHFLQYRDSTDHFSRISV